MEDASGIKFKDARLPNKELILSNIWLREKPESFDQIFNWLLAGTV